MRIVYLFLFIVLGLFSDIQKEVWTEYFPFEIKASSYKKIDWLQYEGNYHPNFAFDNDKKTSWVSGESGKQSISSYIYINNSDKIKIQIENGMQKSKADYESYSRPKEIRLHLKHNGKIKEEILQLEDKLERQEFEIALKDFEIIDGIEFEILKNYSGKKFKETSIADIRIFYLSSNPEVDPNRNSISDWKKDRLEMAKKIQSQKNSPLASPSFESVEEGKETQLPYKQYKKEILIVSKKIAKEKAVLPILQNFQSLYVFETWGYFDKNLSSFIDSKTMKFEASKKKNYLTDKFSSPSDKVTVSLFKVLKENDKIKAISFKAKETIQERGVYIKNTEFLLIYDMNQKLEKVFITNLESPKEKTEIKFFKYNEKNKLDEVIIYHPVYSTDKADKDKYTSSVYKATF